MNDKHINMRSTTTLTLRLTVGLVAALAWAGIAVAGSSATAAAGGNGNGMFLHLFDEFPVESSGEIGRGGPRVGRAPAFSTVSKQGELGDDEDPAADVDAILGRLPADQAKLLGIALHLFENGRFGFRGFSRLTADQQERHLQAWRTGSLALQRSTWGFLHAATASSFSNCANRYRSGKRREARPAKWGGGTDSGSAARGVSIRYSVPSA